MSNKEEDRLTVDVLKFLAELSEGHRFRACTFGGKKKKGRLNCESRVVQPHTLLGVGCTSVDIPVDSEVVIYQDPEKPRRINDRVACIHFPMRDKQVVVYNGGLMEVQRLEGKTTLGRIYNPAIGLDISL